MYAYKNGLVINAFYVSRYEHPIPNGSNYVTAGTTIAQEKVGSRCIVGGSCITIAEFVDVNKL